jgi:TPR repeat protein
MSWFRNAAGREYAKAQINLGAMYLIGRGAAQDYTEAMSWFRKAAEYAEAQSNLGVMYENGL